MLFYKVSDHSEVVSIIMIYVDDFIGVHRSDYKIEEVWNKFKWGSVSNIELNVSVTFKDKTLELKLNEKKRCVLDISMPSFIETLNPEVVRKGRKMEDPKLTPAEFQSSMGSHSSSSRDCSHRQPEQSWTRNRSEACTRGCTRPWTTSKPHAVKASLCRMYQWVARP